MSGPALKAAAFNSMVEVLRGMVGAEPVERFVAQLPSELADYVRRPRLATQWMSLADATEINQRVLEGLFHGDLEQVFELGRRQFKSDLSTVYRFFVRFGSVGFIARKSAAVYATYVRDGGAMRVVREESKLVEIEVTGHPFPRPLIWHQMRGNVHGAIEVSGATGVRSQVAESNAQPSRCLIRATWL